MLVHCKLLKERKIKYLVVEVLFILFQQMKILYRYHWKISLKEKKWRGFFNSII